MGSITANNLQAEFLILFFQENVYMDPVQRTVDFTQTNQLFWRVRKLFKFGTVVRDVPFSYIFRNHEQKQIDFQYHPMDRQIIKMIIQDFSNRSLKELIYYYPTFHPQIRKNMTKFLKRPKYELMFGDVVIKKFNVKCPTDLLECLLYRHSMYPWDGDVLELFYNMKHGSRWFRRKRTRIIKTCLRHTSIAFVLIPLIVDFMLDYDDVVVPTHFFQQNVKCQ